ncbi:MAG: hypothetical protein K1X88_10460 [Nannocystaceae bacterium]|nr:hypothetical protein [Nannocystaceae bacterium]
MARSDRTARDGSPNDDDVLDALSSELSRVEWLGQRLRRDRGARRGRLDEPSLWTRLLAWTQ